MTVLKAIVKDGKIELEAPTDWPEGTEVRVEAVPDSIGIRDEDGPDTPEGIARLLESMDRAEPLEMTAEEEAEWAAARKGQKDFVKARFNAWWPGIVAQSRRIVYPTGIA
jgi:hypothetical protein